MFKLPQSYGRLCDLPHIREIFCCRQRLGASLKNGNIVMKHFLRNAVPALDGPTCMEP